MNLVAAVLALPGLAVLLMFCALHLSGSISKDGHSNKKRLYPSTYSLGLAFQQIQTFVAPGQKHAIAEQIKQEAEQDEDGEASDPEKHLERQLKQIRNGEQIDRLTTLLRENGRGATSRS